MINTKARSRTAQSMPNTPHILHTKLQGVLKKLLAGYEGGSSSSSDKKGSERELFVKVFLEDILPPLYRIGKGDICDLLGHHSGSIDLVVSNPLMPSLTAERSGPRLYIAEGVATCIEIKSNLKDQWDEVTRTAELLFPLQRCYGKTSGFAHSSIPLIAVGFSGGWKTVATLEKKMLALKLAGLLSLDPPVFITNGEWAQGSSLLRYHEGPAALWAFATCVLDFARGLKWTSTSPECYSLRALVFLQNILVRAPSHRDTPFDALSFFGSTPLTKANPFLEDIDKKSRELVEKMYDELSGHGFISKHEDGMITIHSGKLDEALMDVLERMPLMNIPLYQLQKKAST